MAGGDVRAAIYKYFFMGFATIFDFWLFAIIMARYNPSFESTYSGVNIPTSFWQMGAVFAFVGGFWAALSFAVHKNNQGEGFVWGMCAVFAFIFLVGHVAMLVYMYSVAKIWTSFTGDLKQSAQLSRSHLPEQWTQKVPMFGAAVCWCFGTIISAWMSGCCCCAGEF